MERKAFVEMWGKEGSVCCTRKFVLNPESTWSPLKDYKERSSLFTFVFCLVHLETNKIVISDSCMFL